MHPPRIFISKRGVLLILLSCCLSLFVLAGYQENNLTLLWNGAFAIYGSDTLLYDSVSASNSDIKLINADFDIGQKSIPIMTDAKLVFPTGDTLDLCTINEFKRNFENADTLFFKDSAGCIIRIAKYSISTTDVDNYFEAVYPINPLIVPDEYSTIELALDAVTAEDTILIRSGAYDEWIQDKSCLISGIGFTTIDEGAAGYINHRSSNAIHYRISGFRITNDNAKSYLFRCLDSNPSSSATLDHNNWYAVLAANIQAANPLNITNNYSSISGLWRIMPSIDTYRFNNVVFNPSINNQTQLRIEDSAKVVFNNCFLKDNSNSSQGYSFNISNWVNIELNNCSINGSLAYNTTLQNGIISINNCTRPYSNINEEFCYIVGVSVDIDSSSLDSCIMKIYNADVSLTNSNFNNVVFNFSSIPTYTAQNLFIDNINYTASAPINCTFENFRSIITNSIFETFNAFTFRFTNTIADVGAVNFSNCDFKYHYIDEEDVIINTSVDTNIYRFDSLSITGCRFYLSKYYGSDIIHHMVLSYDNSGYFAYNEVYGAMTGWVIKDRFKIGLTNKVLYNKFYNCRTPVYLRSIDSSFIANNIFYNDTVEFAYPVYIDSNGTNPGTSSLGTKLYNNIFYSELGGDVLWLEDGCTIAESDNNIFYSELAFDIDTSIKTISEWQELGYDFNSYNQDPLINSKGIPKTESVAIKGGKDFGEPYNIGLSPLTIWPDSIFTRKQIDSAWSIGVFVVYDKYSFNVSASPTKGGEVFVNPSDTIFEEGDTVNVIGIAADGYEFTGWSNGEAEDTLNITMSTDLELIAYFKKEDSEIENEDDNIYILTAIASPTKGGEVIASPSDSSFEEGEKVKVIAVAYDGYEFANWNTGETEDTLNLTMSSDLVLIAYFELEDSDSLDMGGADSIIDINSITEKVYETLSVKIFPNPVTNISKLEIETNKHIYASVSIISITGKREELYTGIMGVGVTEFTIDASDLNNGVYVLQIITDYKTFSEYFIINR